MKRSFILIATMITMLLCACDSENIVDNVSSDLTCIDWQEVKGSILLNNEELTEASAEFHALPDSDDLMIILHGVHPYEDIEITVTTVTDDEGNIRFSGNQHIEGARNLRIDGVFNSQQSEIGTKGMPSVQIKVTYTVPTHLMCQEIPFDEENGFIYIRDNGEYPKATVDYKAQQDSCELICKNINSELRKNLKSMTFDFGHKGQMAFSYVSSELDKSSQTFRYWVRIEKRTGNKIMEIEKADLFYESVLNAMNVDMTSEVKDFLSSLSHNVCSLYVDNGDSGLIGRVIFLDEIHLNIFTHFYNQFSGKGIWKSNERNYIDLIYKKVYHTAFESPDDVVAFRSYCWAFENHDR